MGVQILVLYMNMKIFLVLIVELILFSSFVSGLEISTPGDAQIGIPSISSPDWDYDFDFSIGGILEWTYELIADFFGVPIEDMKIRGGYLFAFVLAPILLTYMMFFAVIKKSGLFDETPGIEKWVPMLLALLLAPLGIYRRFFFAVTALMTTGTATILYLFLFIMMLGWGMKNMFYKGVGDTHAGAAYAADMKAAKKDMGSVRKDIKRITMRINKLNSSLAGLTKEKDAEKFAAVEAEIKTLDEQKKNLMAYMNSRRDTVHNSFHKLIRSSGDV